MQQESHHTTSVVSVFDVWATYDCNWRKPHYPSFEVTSRKVGSAFSLEGAERIVREAVRAEAHERRSRFYRQRLLSMHVKEMRIGHYVQEWQTESEYIYDDRGIRLDGRTIPYDGDQPFEGRSGSDLRFKAGDLCEVLDGDRIYLGFVVETPPSREWAQRSNAGAFHLEAGDDSYVVLTSSDYRDHDHVDSMRIFPPRFTIAPRTLARLRKAYNDYVTQPVRLRIADTTAAATLRGTAEEIGWDLDLEMPRWPDDTFKLMIRGVPEHPDGLDLQIAQRKAHLRMDRIRTSLLRLAGMPAPGRGYSLKRLEPPAFFKAKARRDYPETYYL